MKQHIVSTIAALFLLTTTAMAFTQSSPNYSINSGRIVSGGTSASSTSGLSKTDIVIGQGLFMPPGGTSSPGYAAKPPSAIAVAAPCGVRSGDINCDGLLDIVDALLAIKAGVGITQLSAAEVMRGDVGPLLNGVSIGDGRINIEDSILILRKAVGLAW